MSHIIRSDTLKTRMNGWVVVRIVSGGYGRLRVGYILKPPGDPEQPSAASFNTRGAAAAWAAAHPWKAENLCRIYVVTFQARHDIKTISYFVYHCIARNAKEACALARDAWRAEFASKRISRLHATRSRVKDAKLLCVRPQDGCECRGSDVMNNIFCTGIQEIAC